MALWYHRAVRGRFHRSGAPSADALEQGRLLPSHAEPVPEDAGPGFTGPDRAAGEEMAVKRIRIDKPGRWRALLVRGPAGRPKDPTWSGPGRSPESQQPGHPAPTRCTRWP